MDYHNIFGNNNTIKNGNVMKVEIIIIMISKV